MRIETDTIVETFATDNRYSSRTKWFAWFPVKAQHCWVWLEYVERIEFKGSFTWWEYKLLEQ